VVQKNGYPVLFWDNFGNSAPIRFNFNYCRPYISKTLVNTPSMVPRHVLYE